MNILFDIKVDNEVIEGVYFLQYQRPIKTGLGTIVMWANDSLRCFDKDDNEVRNLNLLEAEFIKAYDQETGTDITESYNFFVNSYSSIRSNAMYSRSPFARAIVKLEE